MTLPRWFIWILAAIVILIIIYFLNQAHVLNIHGGASV